MRSEPTMPPNPTIQRQGYVRGLMLALLLSKHPALEEWKHEKRFILSRVEGWAFAAMYVLALLSIVALIIGYSFLESLGIERPALLFAPIMFFAIIMGTELIAGHAASRIEREAMWKIGYDDAEIDNLHHQDCLQLIANAA